MVSNLFFDDAAWPWLGQLCRVKVGNLFLLNDRGTEANSSTYSVVTTVFEWQEDQCFDPEQLTHYQRAVDSKKTMYVHTYL